MTKRYEDMTPKEKCRNCNGRKYPAGDYCQGCKLRNYR